MLKNFDKKVFIPEEHSWYERGDCMPKVSFKVPKKPKEVKMDHHHKEVVSLALLGVVASISMVALVLLFNEAFTTFGGVTGRVIDENVCGPQGLIVDDAWYLDQMEKLNYQCLVGSDPRVWCCYKK